MRALSRTLWMSVCLFTILGLTAAGSVFAATRSAAPTSIDDLELAVAQRVPSFGGLYFDGNGSLNIYLTDGAQLAAAESAIAAVFGKDRFDFTNARAVKARYTFTQLKGWHDHHRLVTLAIRGVVSTGIRKSTNHLHIGVTTADAASSVQAVLARYSIPSDAVEIVITPGFDPYDTLLDTHRPLLGGLQITNDKGGLC